MFNSTFSFQEGNVSLQHSIVSKEEYYRQAVVRRAQSSTDGEFSNDSVQNSAAVHEAIFLTAQHSIRVVARGMKLEIFANEHVIDAAVRFVKREHVDLRFDIRTDCTTEEECKDWLFEQSIIQNLKTSKHPSTVVQVFFYAPEGNHNKDRFLPNFGSAALADGKMYRQRRIQADGNYKDTADSVVDFNDASKATAIEKRADILLKNERLLVKITL